MAVVLVLDTLATCACNGLWSTVGAVHFSCARFCFQVACRVACFALGGRAGAGLSACVAPLSSVDASGASLGLLAPGVTGCPLLLLTLSRAAVLSAVGQWDAGDASSYALRDSEAPCATGATRPPAQPPASSMLALLLPAQDGAPPSLPDWQARLEAWCAEPMLQQGQQQLHAGLALGQTSQGSAAFVYRALTLAATGKGEVRGLPWSVG